MVGKRGVVAELLVVTAILVSTVVLVMQFSGGEEVPSVPQKVLDALQDIRDVIAQAILDWLAAGPVDQMLACNGFYPYLLTPESMATGLEPFINAQLQLFFAGEDENVEITAGTLKEISFDGIDGLTITLENGSIIYDDGTIYAADSYDKDYFFNVRLPLALQVITDWHTCDAGNLSENMADGFGDYCFYGKKNPAYPGGCPTGGNYNINALDRDRMLAQAPTIEHVARGVQPSIDTLNAYFRGDESCLAEPLSEDAGIECSFQIEDAEFEYLVVPWSNELLPLSSLQGSDDWEYSSFRTSDTNVWALEPKIIATRYSDTELECDPTGREDIITGLPAEGLPVEDTAYALTDIPPPYLVNANPVMYVNTTRGVKFTLVTTCKDHRVTLLGQELQYRFRSRHGVRVHCGPPDEMINGNYMCNGCGLKPGQNWEQCRTPSLPPCATAFHFCTTGMTWWYLYELEDSPFIPGATWEQTLTMPENDGLMDLINASCGTVWGHMPDYPPPMLDEPGCEGKDPLATPQCWNCRGAQLTICCGTPGYNYTCDPTQNLQNDECYMDQGLYTGWCTAIADCTRDDWTLGAVCYGQICDTSINECIDDEEEISYGAPCNGGNTCYKCADDTGICGIDQQAVDEQRTCDQAIGSERGCMDFTCTPQGCSGIPREDGLSCGSDFCAEITCENGFCTDRELKPGMLDAECGTVVQFDCTYQKRCNDRGACAIAEEISCDEPPDPDDCDPPCQPDGDGGCDCP